MGPANVAIYWQQTARLWGRCFRAASLSVRTANFSVHTATAYPLWRRCRGGSSKSSSGGTSSEKFFQEFHLLKDSSTAAT